MDEYIERFDTHGVHNTIAALREAIDSFEIPEDNPETRDVITRFTRVGNFVCNSIKKSEAALLDLYVTSVTHKQ